MRSLHVLLSCAVNCLIVGSIPFFFSNSIKLVLGLSATHSEIDLGMIDIIVSILVKNLSMTYTSSH